MVKTLHNLHIFFLFLIKNYEKNEANKTRWASLWWCFPQFVLGEGWGITRMLSEVIFLKSEHTIRFLTKFTEKFKENKFLISCFPPQKCPNCLPSSRRFCTHRGQGRRCWRWQSSCRGSWTRLPTGHNCYSPPPCKNTHRHTQNVKTIDHFALH